MLYSPKDAAFLEALGRWFLLGVALSLTGLAIALVVA